VLLFINTVIVLIGCFES